MRMGCEHVEKAYGGKPVLHDFSFAMDSGERRCLFGPSGCGKSTVLRLCLGLDTPDYGRVYGFSSLRLSCQFQQNHLLAWESAWRNLSIACPMTRTRALEVLAMAGLGEDAEKKAAELSGGMQRRISLLRALFHPSDVLMLDEPFIEMDVQTAQTMQRLVLEHLQGRSLLLITHQIQEAERLVGKAGILTMRPAVD